MNRLALSPQFAYAPLKLAVADLSATYRQHYQRLDENGNCRGLYALF